MRPAFAPSSQAFWSRWGVEATITVGPRTENGIPVTLDGPKLGAVIGHRGETLDAIQQLTNYTVNRGRTHRVRIHIDAENYRAKRGGVPSPPGQQGGGQSGQIPSEHHPGAHERL